MRSPWLAGSRCSAAGTRIECRTGRAERCSTGSAPCDGREEQARCSRLPDRFIACSRRGLLLCATARALPPAQTCVKHHALARTYALAAVPDACWSSGASESPGSLCWFVCVSGLCVPDARCGRWVRSRCKRWSRHAHESKSTSFAWIIPYSKISPSTYYNPFRLVERHAC